MYISCWGPKLCGLTSGPVLISNGLYSGTLMHFINRVLYLVYWLVHSKVYPKML